MWLTKARITRYFYPFLAYSGINIWNSSKEYPLRKNAWTISGFLNAIRIFLQDKNALFDDMVKTLYQYPVLKERIEDILFCGTRYTFEINSPVINMGVMFGFLKNHENTVAVANRIFETILYNLFLSEKYPGNTGRRGKNSGGCCVESGTGH